jgi:hypothetical protein
MKQEEKEFLENVVKTTTEANARIEELRTELSQEKRKNEIYEQLAGMMIKAIQDNKNDKPKLAKMVAALLDEIDLEIIKYIIAGKTQGQIEYIFNQADRGIKLRAIKDRYKKIKRLTGINDNLQAAQEIDSILHQ